MTTGSAWPFRSRSSRRRCAAPTCGWRVDAGSSRYADAANGSTQPGSGARARSEEARLPALALGRRFPALLRRAKRDSGGRDRWWYGIERAGSGRNGQLPWNLPGQELWPSRFGSCQSGGTPRSRWSGSKSQGNLEYRACGCQGISGAKQETDSIKTKKTRRKPGENREENMNDRAAAWELLTLFTQSESLRKHALAVEACMRAYARKFSGDEELWAIVGLLHDFDYDKYPSLEDHPYKGNEILKERGWSEEIRKAIMSHAEYTGVTRDTPMEKALFACDELAGFITACALVKPGKSLAEVEAPSVKKKMKDKAFARSVNRQDITNGATELGVDLEQHIAFCIEAMRGIAGELGLDGSAAKTA